MTITATPRLGLNNWGASTDNFTRAEVNADHAALDTLCAIDLQGPLASRPAPGTPGRYYWATDTQQLFREDGTTWFDLQAHTNFQAKMFSVNTPTAHTIPNFLWTVVPFDTVQFDPNGNLTTGANAGYTCPTAGFYRVDWLVVFTTVNLSSIWTLGAVLNKNGVQASSAPQLSVTTAAAPSTGATDLVQCAAGDLLQIVALQNTGGPLALANINPLSRMAVSLASR